LDAIFAIELATETKEGFSEVEGKRRLVSSEVPNTTVRFLGASKPAVVWRASGDITIYGVLELSASGSTPGQGGWSGGRGGNNTSHPTKGQGPGGGGFLADPTNTRGGGAGHSTPGAAGTNGIAGGKMYGNSYLQPLMGGSGGGGGNAAGSGFGSDGGGGGALPAYTPWHPPRVEFSEIA
jgi:hypothetical protein